MAEITITRLGHLGDGIAEGPVYAARTLPGEVITGEQDGGRIAAPRIVIPSPDRVRPPCPHYKSCGGCQVMHASDTFVAGWKQDILREAMAAQGLEAPITGSATSPPGSRRRATFSGRRIKSGALVGFHAAKSDIVVPVPNCHVLAPELLAVLPALEELVGRTASRKGELIIAVTATETGVDCAISGGRDLDAELSMALPRFAPHFARLSWNGEVVFAETPPRIFFGPVPVIPPPGAFLQATAEGEAALVGAAKAALDGASSIADLFSGCGTFTFPLAEALPVHAVEGDAGLLSALEAAERHATGLKPVTTEARDLFRRPLMADELSRFDGLVIDPPRAGAEAQMRRIAEAQVPRLALISCNPASFARDAKILTDAGYVIDWIRVVDQFRWSAHVELAAAARLPHIPASAPP